LLLAVFELVLFMIVPRDLLVHYHAFYAIHSGEFYYNAYFVITVISLGSQKERYNEIAV